MIEVKGLVKVVSDDEKSRLHPQFGMKALVLQFRRPERLQR